MPDARERARTMCADSTPKEARAILVTGAAGFIGFHLSRHLLGQGIALVGLDNLNNYYDPELKQDRRAILEGMKGFEFVRGDLCDMDGLTGLFERIRPRTVVHLAAQAGVRYSIDHPRAYIDSNVTGFFNMLEACRRHPVEHLVYASSSSVYGNQEKTPFSTADDVSRPVSLYAATKICNELMARTYAHLYGIPSTGLRFFTVYGPYGRPDMAYFSFAQKMLRREAISLYNHGDMKRDFTYIDDIVQGVASVLGCPPGDPDPARVYNIGNNHPEDLRRFVEVLESCLMAEGLIDRPAEKRYLPMQPGDVYQTCADISALERDFGFKPSTPIEVGLAAFVRWYREYEERKRSEGAALAREKAAAPP